MRILFISNKVAEFIKYIILAIVQGISEILPISSSGHLIVTKRLLQLESAGLTLEIFFHFASLIALCFFFRKKLWTIVKDFFVYLLTKKAESRSNFLLGIYLIIATIPAGIAGILLEDKIEQINQLWLIGLFLYVTALLLFVSTKIKREKTIDDLKWYHALYIGLFQCLGLFPGVSRSGSALSGGAVQKVKQADAAEFAFLLAIPVMLGSAILSIKDLSVVLKDTSLIPPYLVSFIICLVISYIAIKYFFAIIKKQKLSIFAVYCLFAGTLFIILNFII